MVFWHIFRFYKKSRRRRRRIIIFHKSFIYLEPLLAPRGKLRYIVKGVVGVLLVLNYPFTMELLWLTTKLKR
jgi:hypothetical protein